MNILEIIQKKHENQILTAEEIDYFVQGYTKGLICDEDATCGMFIYFNALYFT